MERYRLEEVLFGTDEAVLWVTLGFVSSLCSYDVLHLVCGTEPAPQDEKLGLAGLYLKRFDQL